MRWPIVIGLLGGSLMPAQPRDPLLGLARRMVTGYAVDESGQPLEGVRVGHSATQREFDVSTKTGFFEVNTQAPRLVLRKPGYESVILEPEEYNPKTRVRMIRSESALPECPKKATCEGWMFCFSTVSGVSRTDPVSDIDYTALSYRIRTHRGILGLIGNRYNFMTHGNGYAWDFGLPDNEFVWESTAYSERTYSAYGRSIIDARGRTPAGTFWRYFGALGESISYHGVTEAVARQFDGVLDSVCLRKPAELR